MTSEQVANLKKGSRVVMTSFGYERLVARFAPRGKARITSGKFLGHDTYFTIRVLRDEHRTPDIYHIDFWEPVK